MGDYTEMHDGEQLGTPWDAEDECECKGTCTKQINWWKSAKYGFFFQHCEHCECEDNTTVLSPSVSGGENQIEKIKE